MNFFFGQTHSLTAKQAAQNQQDWLARTIFGEYGDKITTHNEPGFSLTLVNDPRGICPWQSNSIHIDDDFVCATDCRLFNKGELTAQLGITTDSTNERFMIAAYRRWGNTFPGKFDGKFSFVLWNRKEKYFLAGRDHLGYGMLAYSTPGGRLCFSSDLATLLDSPDIDPSVNIGNFYYALEHQNFEPAETLFKSCKLCPPGHTLNYSENKTSLNDYWKLAPGPKLNLRSNEEYASRFNQVLERVILNEVTPDKVAGILLSGGNDSSLLAAIACESIPKNHLKAYSYTYDNFSEADESKHILETARILEIEAVCVNCDDRVFLSDSAPLTVSKDVLMKNYFLTSPEAVFKQAQSEHCTQLISGLYGDHLFAAGRYLFADLISQNQWGEIFQLVKNSRNTRQTAGELIQNGFRPLLPGRFKSLYRKLKGKNLFENRLGVPPEFLHSFEGLAYPGKQCTQHQKNLFRTIYYSSIHSGIYFYRKHLYLGFGINVMTPYYSKQVLEFMWSLPVNQIAQPGKNRFIQKNALKAYKLKHIINRTGKANFMDIFTTGLYENSSRVLNIIDQSELIKIGMLDARTIFGLAASGEIDDKVALGSFIMAEFWWRAINTPGESFNQLRSCSFENNALSLILNSRWNI